MKIDLSGPLLDLEGAPIAKRQGAPEVLAALVAMGVPQQAAESLANGAAQLAQERAAKREDWTLAAAVVAALQYQDRDATPEQRFDRIELALRVRECPRAVDLRDEEKSLIRRLVAQTFQAPVVSYRIKLALDTPAA